MASIRQERVAELLKRELSILFQRESNTWFGGLFITVTQVRIGPDLETAETGDAAAVRAHPFFAGTAST